MSGTDIAYGTSCLCDVRIIVYRPTACYAMPAIDVACDADSLRFVGILAVIAALVQNSAVGLPACYAMPSTDV
eukprot:3791138-Rhodomonas_salina.3